MTTQRAVGKHGCEFQHTGHPRHRKQCRSPDLALDVFMLIIPAKFLLPESCKHFTAVGS